MVPQAAADKAGLLSGDLITKVDGRRVKTSNHVVDLVNDKDPGDVVVLSILRKGDERDFRITLGHRSVTFDLFNRNMQMSGPVSKRKDNFPLVFQHDLPLEREAMGGPVFDLNGKCLGINIARVDRVTVFFSLPSKKLFGNAWKIFSMDWMPDDHTKPYVILHRVRLREISRCRPAFRPIGSKASSTQNPIFSFQSSYGVD